ncbi:MAG: HEAT repeat domain-containing protein [Gemmataceae bacterium]
MKRLLFLSVTVLIGLAASARAGGLCGCEGRCKPIPPPVCPDCACPCDEHRIGAVFGCEHANKLIEDLHACTCCDRIKAVKKLGHRLHADFCANPEVLAALINALQCDPCWEVRREAAWSILSQGARTEQGVMALFVASRLDPHYVVRDRAAEALDILLVGGKRACFKTIFDNGDKLIKDLKKAGYKPGTANCQMIMAAQAELIPAPINKAEGGSPATPGAVEVDSARPLPAPKN